MEVVIRVKVRGPKAHLETRIKPGSKDNVREQNMGREMLDCVNTLCKKIMQRGGGTWQEVEA